MKKKLTPLRAFMILCAVSIFLWIFPWLYSSWVRVSLVFYVAQQYFVTPLLSLILPFFCGKIGVHPMAAFFPIGLSLLLSPWFHGAGMGLVCLVLSLVSCVAGQEWQKRAAAKVIKKSEEKNGRGK